MICSKCIVDSVNEQAHENKIDEGIYLTRSLLTREVVTIFMGHALCEPHVVEAMQGEVYHKITSKLAAR